MVLARLLVLVHAETFALSCAFGCFSNAWILQDFLGVVFCMQMMKTIRLPHLKVCVISATMHSLVPGTTVFRGKFFSKFHGPVCQIPQLIFLIPRRRSLGKLKIFFGLFEV